MQTLASNTTNQDWTTICSTEELIDNIGICVLLDGIQIAVFKLSGDDELYAINNYDPFSNTNVLSRGVIGDIKGEPVVASPIYKQHFSLLTGICIEDEDVKIDSYPVRRTDGSIQISLSTRSSNRGSLVV